ETPTAAPATETPTIAPPTETPTPGGPTSTPAPIPATGPAGLGLLLLGLGALLGTHSIRRR
ncbi:hypothetical protein JXA40_05370, partial [bacterium]|nr:hypothetical protein [candidate division CSSED10-310 bacterium]